MLINIGVNKFIYLFGFFFSEWNILLDVQHLVFKRIIIQMPGVYYFMH